MSFLQGAHWLHRGRPRILGFPQFSECQRVRHMARRKGLTKALLANPQDNPPTLRTSDSCWLGYHHPGQLDYYDERGGDTTAAAADDDETDRQLLRDIGERASVASGFPASNGETFQVLRYRAGQYYGPHVDYFSPESHREEWQHAGGGQRVATLLVYLNTPNPHRIRGGETHFPWVDVGETNGEDHPCQGGSESNPQRQRQSRRRRLRKSNHKKRNNHKGLLIRPQQGTAVLFWNVQTEHPQRVEPYSVHESTPIVPRPTQNTTIRQDTCEKHDDNDDDALLLETEKWTLTRWIRQRPFPIPMRAHDDDDDEG